MTVPCIASPTIGRVLYTPAAGTAGIAGSATNEAGGAAVPGGKVWLFDDTAVKFDATEVIGTATVDGSGDYEFTDLAAGDYYVMDQPPRGFGLGSSEPNAHSVTVTAGNTTTQNLVRAAMYYYKPFSDFDDVTDFTGGTFWTVPTGESMSGTNHTDNMTFEATAGALGGGALRYTWPARPDGGNYTIALTPRIVPAPSSPTMYVQFTTNEMNSSGPWEIGDVGGSQAYKFFLVQYLRSGGGFAKYGLYLHSGGGGTLRVFVDLTDTVNGTLDQDPDVEANLGTWGSAGAVTWLMELLGVGTASSSLNVYADGVLVGSVGPIAMLDGENFGNYNLTFDMGNVINSGPEHSETRDWSEFGVSTTRPSMLNMAAA